MHACVAVTTAIALTCIASRLATECAGGTTVIRGGRLVERATYSHALATAEPDVLVRTEHLASALAFLQAAREFSADDDLERATGVDVQKLWTDTSALMRSTRQNGAPPAAA